MKNTNHSTRGGRRAASAEKKEMTRWLKVILIILLLLALVGAGLYIAWKSIVRPPKIEDEHPAPPTDTVVVTTQTPPPAETDAPPEPAETGGEIDPPDPVYVPEPGDGEGRTSQRKDGVYTVLMMGHNQGLTDVMMLAAFDTVNNTINVLSIPRDTYSDTKSRAVHKINGAYNTGGMEQVYYEVERLVGFEPDNYVLVDYDGFVELIDAIGGVDYNVPMDMFHRDDDGKVDINLKKGYQHLDGKQALGLCRYRSGYPGQDLGRISTAQGFLKAAAKKAVSVISPGKITDFVNIYSEYVETDLSVGNIVWFLQNAWQNVDPEEGLTFETIPVLGGGFNGTSYVFAIKDQTIDLVNELINPYKTEIKASDVSILSEGEAYRKYGT